MISREHESRTRKFGQLEMARPRSCIAPSGAVKCMKLERPRGSMGRGIVGKAKAAPDALREGTRPPRGGACGANGRQLHPTSMPPYAMPEVNASIIIAYYTMTSPRYCSLYSKVLGWDAPKYSPARYIRCRGYASSCSRSIPHTTEASWILSSAARSLATPSR